jgi:hypothetical protein
MKFAENFTYVAHVCEVFLQILFYFNLAHELVNKYKLLQ